MREPVVDTDAVGHMVIRSRMKNQNIAEQRQPQLYEDKGRVRRRLILQLSFQIMIIVKESDELDYRD